MAWLNEGETVKGKYYCIPFVGKIRETEFSTVRDARRYYIDLDNQIVVYSHPRESLCFEAWFDQKHTAGPIGDIIEIA